MVSLLSVIGGLFVLGVPGLFLGPLVLPFEVLSVLLLAAMIGAIVLARKKDP